MDPPRSSAFPLRSRLTILIAERSPATAGMAFGPNAAPSAVQLAASAGPVTTSVPR